MYNNMYDSIPTISIRQIRFDLARTVRMHMQFFFVALKNTIKFSQFSVYIYSWLRRTNLTSVRQGGSRIIASHLFDFKWLADPLILKP